MAIFEVSFLYGLISSLFKSSFSIIVASVLLALVAFAGAIFSPLDLGHTLHILVAIWIGFNVGLGCYFFLPLLFQHNVKSRNNGKASGLREP